MLVSFTIIFAWTLQMLSIYFAMTYRPYLPRSRSRRVISETVLEKKLEGRAMQPNMAVLQTKPVHEKELKLSSGGVWGPVSEKRDLQPVPDMENDNNSHLFHHHLGM